MPEFKHNQIDADWLEKARNELYGTVQTDRAAWIGRKRRPVYEDTEIPTGDAEQPGQTYEASKSPSWWLGNAGELAENTARPLAELTGVPATRRYLESVESGRPLAPVAAGAEAVLNMPTSLGAGSAAKLTAKALGTVGIEDAVKYLGVIGIPAKGAVKKLREVMAIENRARGAAEAGDTVGKILRGTFWHGRPRYPKVEELGERLVTSTPRKDTTTLYEGLPSYRDIRGKKGNLGEPEGISLSYDPAVAAHFSDSAPNIGRVFPRYGGKPEDKILKAWTPEAGEILNASYEDAVHEVFTKSKGLASDVQEAIVSYGELPGKAFRNVLQGDQVKYREFNKALTASLQNKGYKGILYSPGRYDEQELRMFNPEDVLHLDERSKDIARPSLTSAAYESNLRSRLWEGTQKKLIEHQKLTSGAPAHLYEHYENIDLDSIIFDKVQYAPARTLEQRRGWEAARGPLEEAAKASKSKQLNWNQFKKGELDIPDSAFELKETIGADGSVTNTVEEIPAFESPAAKNLLHNIDTVVSHSDFIDWGAGPKVSDAEMLDAASLEIESYNSPTAGKLWNSLEEKQQLQLIKYVQAKKKASWVASGFGTLKDPEMVNVVQQELSGYSAEYLELLTPESVVADVSSTIDPAFHGQNAFNTWSAAPKSQQLQIAKDALNIVKTKNSPENVAKAKKITDYWKTLEGGTWADPPGTVAKPKVGAGDMSKPAYFGPETLEEAAYEKMFDQASDPEVDAMIIDAVVAGEQYLKKVGKPLTSKEWFTDVYGEEMANKIATALKAVK
jgi:hypothetical protein